MGGEQQLEPIQYTASVSVCPFPHLKQILLLLTKIHLVSKGDFLSLILSSDICGCASFFSIIYTLGSLASVWQLE